MRLHTSKILILSMTKLLEYTHSAIFLVFEFYYRTLYFDPEDTFLVEMILL